MRAGEHTGQLNKTLPAWSWNGKATIPVIEGIHAERSGESAEEIPYGPGDEIGRHRLIQFLCRGAQSTLFLGEDRRQNRVVIKIYDAGAARSTTALRKMADLTRSGSCRSLMPILGYGDLEGGIHYEIMPVYQQGTLENVVITEDEMIKSILPQLNEALRFMQANHLVHNDIKPSNIFWKDRAKKEIVLGDYDCLTFDKDEKAGGSLLFMAPERIYTDGDRHTGASEYCSLGLTLMTLLSGRSPLDENEAAKAPDPQALRQHLYRRWQSPVVCPPSLAISSKTRNLLNGMVQDKPESRYDGEYIANWLENGGVGFKTYHNKAERSMVRGLPYRGKLILDIQELIQVLGNDWNYGVFMLEQHQLDEFVRQFDGKFFRYSQQYASSFDKEAGLFKLMQSLSPSVDFYWKGVHYESLEDFVNQTEEHGRYGMKDPFCHFCRARLISFYEEKNGGTKQQTERAMQIEQIGRSSPELAVKKLQISLRQKPDFIWHGATLLTVDDLLTYLENCSDRLDEEVEALYESKAFKVWLDYIEHGSMLSSIEKALMESGI